jgi:hypothetical protein
VYRHTFIILCVCVYIYTVCLRAIRRRSKGYIAYEVHRKILEGVYTHTILLLYTYIYIYIYICHQFLLVYRVYGGQKVKVGLYMRVYIYIYCVYEGNREMLESVCTHVCYLIYICLVFILVYCACETQRVTVRAYIYIYIRCV